MSPDRSHGHRLPDQSKPIPPPLRRHASWCIDHFLFSVFLCLLLVAQIPGNWSFLVTPAYAESQGTRPSAPASMTFQKFLHEGHQDKVYHGPLIRPQHVPPPPGPTHGQTHTADYAHRPPSAEPATMKPMNAPLTAAFLSGQKATPALDLLSSDGRLEVQLQPGSLDLSHATVPGGKPPAGTLTLRVSQLYGHYASAFNELGTYQVQLGDSQGRVVSGVRLHTPLILIYHYQPSEVAALSLDPAHLFMTWPILIATATKAHKPTTGLIIALQNNAAAHTLTASSGVFDPSPFTMGDGESPNQGPPPLHLASVQGNAGQLTYSYPLQVAPGTGGFAPQLTLSYSSSDPNERHSATSPANDVGDGWSLSLGSISADTYPNTGTTWYFLGGVANVADRLIPNGSLYDTEHLSYLRIQQETSSQTGQPCFQVWDKSGTYYELGCTSDSLQYWNDSNGRHNYRWDVNKIIAPNEGPNAGTYKMLTVSYLQDVVTSGGYTSIRDAVMKQIVYGAGNSNVVTNVAGTVDFTYKAPFNSAPWASAYGTNYNCSSGPPINTTLRCDDPVQMPGSGKFPVPTVMSTFSLQTVTSYVGSDSTYKDYSYSFSYTDNPFQSCNDPVTLLPGYCAREHLLMSITPTVYQNNTAHALPQVIFGYTNPLQNTYYDSTHQVGSPS
ncbi:MAG TPA: hypothetical protein VFA09_19425 [Ktedonobacteraceae bacterium]|nr:hypothetical protein [Ktedonobacteraceae bacterium]